VDFEQVIASGYLVGRAPEQVEEFVREEIEPVLARFPHRSDLGGEIAV
jgi:hypothetical protein